MDNPEEGLPGPVAVNEEHTVVSTSPRGSVTSRHSSESNHSHGSFQSGRTSIKARPQAALCRSHCNTVLACLLVGVMITLGSVAMTACGYFALNIASETVEEGNSTTVILDEQLHENLFKFRTLGPVMIGFGGFLIMCACVLLCEEKDKKKKRNQASENLLSDHERIMQQARERFYNENRKALMAETQTVDYRTPKVLPNETTSCLDSDMIGNSVAARVKPLAPSADETDNASGASASPVVLVHGPTIVEPPQCVDVIKKHNSGESQRGSDSSLNSDSPERRNPSPSRNAVKGDPNNPPSTSNLMSSGPKLLNTPILPKIDSPKSGDEISRAGGAIPKSILVQPMKLSPIRSVNGPIRVRLEDSPTELSPVSPSTASKSAENLQHPRSPGSIPRRLKRGKKKKSAGGLEPVDLGRCRCLSDPTIASPWSVDRQLDACCCLQPECCWEENCTRDKSIAGPSSSAYKNPSGPLADLAATNGKPDSPLLQTLSTDLSAKAQCIEMTPKNTKAHDPSDVKNLGSNHQETSLQETPIIQKSPQKQTTGKERETVRNSPKKSAPTSPARKRSTAQEPPPCAGEDANSDSLVQRDRNSNITVSSRRQDIPGKSAPYGGQQKGSVMV